jgi:DNA-binding GntR family transcriptional regulator
MRSVGRPVLEEEPGPAVPVASLVDRLRAAIVLGTVAPGERLVQADLAARFGVSRIPLREALYALQGEGLVVIEPNRGTICRPLEARDLADLYTLRIALEQLAVTAAAERFVDLRAATDRMSVLALAAHAAGDLNRMIALDCDFHAALAEGAGNVHLARALGSCWSQIMRGMHFYFTLDVYPPDVWSEHLAIAQAVALGDTEGALARATAHIGTSRNAILEALRGKKR